MLAFFARKLALVEQEARARECEIRDARNPNPRDQESIHLIGKEGQTFRISLAKVYIIASLKPTVIWSPTSTYRTFCPSLPPSLPPASLCPSPDTVDRTAKGKGAAAAAAATANSAINLLLRRQDRRFLHLGRQVAKFNPVNISRRRVFEKSDNQLC